MTFYLNFLPAHEFFREILELLNHIIRSNVYNSFDYKITLDLKKYKIKSISNTRYIYCFYVFSYSCMYLSLNFIDSFIT